MPLLDWAGRNAYLLAKGEEKEIELYGLDLIWLLVKTRYNGLTQPSDIYHKKKIVDNRSGKEIAEDVLRGMGGE